MRMCRKVQKLKTLLPQSLNLQDTTYLIVSCKLHEGKNCTQLKVYGRGRFHLGQEFDEVSSDPVLKSGKECMLK